MYISNESIFLINFMVKNINIIYLNTNHKINIFLKKIYQEIKEANIYLKNNVTINGQLEDYDNKTNPESFTYIPITIQKHINKKSKKIIFYLFNNFIGRKVTIYFISENDDDTIDLTYYNTCVQQILSWIFVLNNYSETKCSKTIKIYFFMSSLSKEFPKSHNLKKNAVLGSKEINTAFTTSCPYDGEIVIFRKEEWFKVFIHETMHAFGIDFSYDINSDNKICNEKILTIFKVNSQVNFYETYTEFWAEIINIIFLSYDIVNNDTKYNKTYNILEKYIDTFNFLVNNERKYTIIQVIKILKYMNLTYCELCYGKSIDKYKENTNILSYYILKLVVLYNYNYFLEWCINNNVNTLKFDNTLQNKINFCVFIEKNYKKKNMMKDINDTEKLLGDDNFMCKLNYEENEIDYFNNNLRMTIYG